jgi:hypothetical protein
MAAVLPIALAWWACEFGNYVDLGDKGSHIGNGECGEGTSASDSGNGEHIKDVDRE